MNLRGLREAGLAFAAPTYLFATGVVIMIITGLFRAVVGNAAGGRERQLPDRGAVRLTAR